MTKLDGVIAVIGTAVAMISIGYTIGVHSRMKDICDKLDCSIDNLADSIDVDVPEAAVEQAVEKAVNREVNAAARRTVEALTNEMDQEIRRQVESITKDKQSEIEEKVAREVSKQISHIDERDLKREIVRKAKDQVAQKFDGELEDILEGFNGNLQNVTKIYKSIADSVHNTGSGSKDFVFRMS